MRRIYQFVFTIIFPIILCCSNPVSNQTTISLSGLWDIQGYELHRIEKHGMLVVDSLHAIFDTASHHVDYGLMKFDKDTLKQYMCSSYDSCYSIEFYIYKVMEQNLIGKNLTENIKDTLVGDSIYNISMLTSFSLKENVLSITKEIEITSKNNSDTIDFTITYSLIKMENEKLKWNKPSCGIPKPGGMGI